MFVTNGKVITTKDQTDLESLQKFIEAIFQNFGTIKGVDIEPQEFYEERQTYVCYNIPDGMELNYLIDEGCEYVAIEPSDIIEKRGTVLVTFKYQFTPEEIGNNADQLARFVMEQDEIEQEKKEVMSQYKAKLDEASAKISKYANWVRSGYEMRDEDCRLVLDYGKGKRMHFSKKSGKLVKEENLWPDDRQLMLSLVPNSDETSN
jgi:hypothetical protein